jgi:hypothetical protein
MPDLLVLFLAAYGTALATGLGVIPIWFLGDPADARSFLAASVLRAEA